MPTAKDSKDEALPVLSDSDDTYVMLKDTVPITDPGPNIWTPLSPPLSLKTSTDICDDVTAAQGFSEVCVMVNNLGWLKPLTASPGNDIYISKLYCGDDVNGTIITSVNGMKYKQCAGDAMYAQLGSYQPMTTNLCQATCDQYQCAAFQSDGNVCLTFKVWPADGVTSNFALNISLP